jgi:hypothetical protein
MRDRVNVFYYPEMVCDNPTLKKAILFFDEIHFMDRPAFTFGSHGTTNCGMIGTQSPLRQFEQSFRKEGVPLYVHGAPGGPVDNKTYREIVADVNDLQFVKSLQAGIGKSETFRRLQIAPGNYGAWGDQDTVARLVTSVDLDSALSSHATPIQLFEDKEVPLFDFGTPTGCAKNLIMEAVTCSAKMNFALNVSSKNGFIPLADAAPYGDLLSAKYRRAVAVLGGDKPTVQLTDLSFAVFDELMPTGWLDEMKFGDVVSHRKKSESAREEFLEHLALLQAKQGPLADDADYNSAIAKLVKTEIIPAAKTFKKKLQAIDESLYGSIAKGVFGSVLAGAVGLNFFGEMSWEKLLGLAAPAVGYLGKSAIDQIVAERALKRECAISYVLSLDE